MKGGILVNVVRGCNCPLLIKTIRSELEKEHKVINGTSERVPVSLFLLLFYCYQAFNVKHMDMEQKNKCHCSSWGGGGGQMGCSHGPRSWLTTLAELGMCAMTKDQIFSI